MGMAAHLSYQHVEDKGSQSQTVDSVSSDSSERPYLSIHNAESNPGSLFLHVHSTPVDLCGARFSATHSGRPILHTLRPRVTFPFVTGGFLDAAVTGDCGSCF